MDNVDCGDGGVGGSGPSKDVFDGAGLGVGATAKCANSGIRLEEEAGDFVCLKRGDLSIGWSDKPLLRTYSCHFGSLRSGGAGKEARCDDAFGTGLPCVSAEALLDESVESLGVTLEGAMDSGRRLLSLRSLFRGLAVGDTQPSAGAMAEDEKPRG